MVFGASGHQASVWRWLPPEVSSILSFFPGDRVRDAAQKEEDETREIWPSRGGREYLGYINPRTESHY